MTSVLVSLTPPITYILHGAPVCRAGGLFCGYASTVQEDTRQIFLHDVSVHGSRQSNKTTNLPVLVPVPFPSASLVST